MGRIIVLRLGHRKKRDKRITTHVGLVARAFGANGIILSGERDDDVLKSLEKVCEKWGYRNFEISYVQDWLGTIINFKKEGWLIVHLTMYGVNIQYPLRDIKNLFYNKGKNLLVIIGAEKVPGKIYEIAHYNIAIGNQPHSEVAALAVFLDRLFNGRELLNFFEDAKIQIIPSTNSKKVIMKINK